MLRSPEISRRPVSAVRTGLFALALALLIASVASPAAQAGRTARVLLLFAIRNMTPMRETVETTFSRVLELRHGAAVDLQVEYLDLADAEKTPYVQHITDLMAAKYGGQRFDVVVAHRTEALGYVLARRSQLFPGVPVVFLDIAPGSLERLGPLPADVTGVQTIIDAKQAVRESLQLRPGTRSVALVGGASMFDRVQNDVVMRALQAQDPPVDIVQLAGLSLDDQLERVATLSDHSIVVIHSYRADSSGRSQVPDDAVERIAAAASVPTFGYVETWLGHGIVGGRLIQYDVLAERAAVMTARILKGESAASIPQHIEPVTVPLFDGRQLRRWGLDERRLPAGSRILFREQTVWSVYTTQIVGGIVLLLGQGALIALIAILLIERRSRRRAQEKLSEAELCYRTVTDFTADLEYWIRPDGSFAYVSPSCLPLTGHEPAAFMERPALMTELVVDEDRQTWESQHRLAATSAGPLRGECRLRSKDGEVRWTDVVVSPVATADGQQLGVRGSLRDITTRKRAEDVLREALDENRRLRRQLEIDNSYLREEMQRDSGIDGILGSSEMMRYVVSKIQQVALTQSTVMLLGETGVGKTMLAQALHNLSPRKARPLVTLNCAALPPTLVESELFGHERGAFTGAQSRRVGRFEIANGGTLFLDEIGELPLDLQAKLLRAVQDGEFERVGSNVPVKTDVRLIVATNRQLEAEVRAGRFRQDLFYRLNIFPITVPPLRQRPEDVPQLAAHFVQKHCRQLGRPVLEISKATMETLQAQGWPGNVRELENVIERAVILSHGKWIEISNEDALAPESHSARSSTPSPAGVAGGRTRMADLQREHIRATLESLFWRVEGPGGAAEALGMNASTLRSRMRKLGIQRPGRPPASVLRAS
jgi:formate hydrogenlyase transcriptional activator